MTILFMIFMIWLIGKMIRLSFRFSWGILKLIGGILLFAAAPVAILILLTFGFTALLLLPLGMFSIGLPGFRRGNVI